MQQNPAISALTSTKRPWLTDGGFETSMLFIEGFELPSFAAIVLLDDAEARNKMSEYFDRFLAMAADAGSGFVLDTNTWRGAPHWGAELGRSDEEMLRLNRDAVDFAIQTRSDWESRVPHVVISGCIGPAGDGYAPDTMLAPEAAQMIHTPQINELANSGVDMIAGLTITHTGEGIGIARAAQAAGLPVVISYTVETDGRLPSGETLARAIERTDDETGNAPIYYMINCAHPDHFRDALENGSDWLDRIGGIRGNASRLSHAELDACEELDDGDPTEFGDLHSELAEMLPNLRVIGGCCGTDHRHVGCVSDRLHHRRAA